MPTISEEVAELRATLGNWISGGTQELERIKGLLATAEKESKESKDRVTQLEADVKARDEKIGKLEADLKAATEGKAKAEGQVGELEAKVKATEESVEARAQQKALAIEQKRGVVDGIKDNARNENPAGDKGGAKGGSITENRIADFQKQIDAKMGRN
jgi:septal ring factor EnvC (AmiA/AmiB activator)